jgi:uncharacterized protein YbjT (DUF2867 family)
MSRPEHTVLLLGGTGRTGRLVLRQLLERGAGVRAVVRSADRLPGDLAGRPGLTVVEADLLSLTDEDLRSQVRGCDAVVSCLGHTASLQGFFGPPRDLVTRALTRVCEAIRALEPAEPVRVIVMSSVSVNHPAGLDARRGRVEKALLWLLTALMPPGRDNQRAADFLWRAVGSADPFVEWVAVRPDSLQEGEVSAYALHEELVSSLFSPDKTRMANVADFMSELVTDGEVWSAWRHRLPVIIDAPAK